MIAERQDDDGEEQMRRVRERARRREEKERRDAKRNYPLVDEAIKRAVRERK